MAERIVVVRYQGPGSVAEDPWIQQLKAEGWRVESALLDAGSRAQTVSVRLVWEEPAGGEAAAAGDSAVAAGAA